MQYKILVKLKNESGALARMIGIFAARGYNLESLTVANSKNHARATLVMNDCPDKEQILKQLRKIIPVLDVEIISETLELVIVEFEENLNDNINSILNKYSAKIISNLPLKIQLTSDKTTQNLFLNEISTLKIKEIIHSGEVAL